MEFGSICTLSYGHSGNILRKKSTTSKYGDDPCLTKDCAPPKGAYLGMSEPALRGTPAAVFASTACRFLEVIITPSNTPRVAVASVNVRHDWNTF